MSALLVDSFDLYNDTGTNTGVQSNWTLTNTVASWSLTTGRITGQCIAENPTPAERSFRRTTTTHSSGTIGFAYRQVSFGGAGTTNYMLHMKNGATYQLGLSITDTGVISVGRYTALTSGTDLAASVAGKILANTWHYIELEYVLSDTVGRVTVYVDGQSVATASNVDTINSGATVNTVQIGGQSTASGWGQSQYDDMYVINVATRLGERRVETVYPTSDVLQGFARSTGATNYTLVDEAQVNGDTDYVQSATPGDVDLYGFGSLTGVPTAIDAVQVSMFAKKTDANTRSIYEQVKSSSTASDGSSVALSSSYGKYERILETDPNGNIAWAAAAVNALQAGPKVA